MNFWEAKRLKFYVNEMFHAGAIRYSAASRILDTINHKSSTILQAMTEKEIIEEIRRTKCDCCSCKLENYPPNKL